MLPCVVYFIQPVVSYTKSPAESNISSTACSSTTTGRIRFESRQLNAAIMFLTRSLSTRSTRSCYKALPSTDSVADQSQPLAPKPAAVPQQQTQQQEATPATAAPQRPAGLRRTSSLRRGAQHLKRQSSSFAERTNPFALHSVVEEVDLRVAGGWW